MAAKKKKTATKKKAATKPKTKAKPKAKAKAKPKKKAAAKKKPANVGNHTASSITREQIAYLVGLAKDADDDGLLEECAIALDMNATPRNRKGALEICADTLNRLESIAVGL